MAFIDELKLYIKAGDGGDGVVRWRQDKYEPMGGPAGGNGGRGGNVIIETIQDVAILEKYSHDPKFIAGNGEPGNRNSMHGANAEDLVIKLPKGTVITDLDTDEVIELTEIGQKVELLRGGAGGLGNEHFKSSTNTTPYEYTTGRPGKDGSYKIELRLFADIGLVGFPNAGKSSLLNAITNAKSKIGAYPFTTLDPHLGVFQEFVVADIPGIIEGASEGKGLGSKFLRHISRTKSILHLVSFEHELDGLGGMMKAYNDIRKELTDSGHKLEEKSEIILLTKTDVTDKEMVKKVTKEFEALGKPVFALTMFDDDEIKQVADEVVKILRK